MFKIPDRAAWWIAGGLSVVTFLTAAGVVRWLHASPPDVFAEVSVDSQALKALAGLEPEFEFDLQREATFITGPVLLDAALKRPEIRRLEIVKRQAADPRAWLMRNIRVECSDVTVLRISYSGQISVEAATLVNSIAAAYIDEMVNEAAHLRAERVDLLERAQRDARNRLAEKRVAIGRLEELLASSAAPADVEGDRPEGDETNVWALELESLRKAVEQGAEIEARIAAELETLKREPRRTGIELRRAARL